MAMNTVMTMSEGMVMGMSIGMITMTSLRVGIRWL
jgi:hypothetical protein